MKKRKAGRVEIGGGGRGRVKGEGEGGIVTGGSGGWPERMNTLGK